MTLTDLSNGAPLLLSSIHQPARLALAVLVLVAFAVIVVRAWMQARRRGRDGV